MPCELSENNLSYLRTLSTCHRKIDDKVGNL